MNKETRNKETIRMYKNSYKILFFTSLLFFSFFVLVRPVGAQLAEGEYCECETFIISSELSCNVGEGDYHYYRTYAQGNRVNWVLNVQGALQLSSQPQCGQILTVWEDLINKDAFTPPLPEGESLIDRYSCTGFPRKTVNLPSGKRFDFEIKCSGTIKTTDECVSSVYEAVCELQSKVTNETTQQCVDRRVKDCLIRKGELCADGSEPGKFGCSKVAEVIEGLNPINLSGGTFVQKIQFFIGRIIKYILGFTGSLALAMFVYAGFMYMTARGNSEQISKALRIMTWAGLGTIVVLASYILVNFVFGIF